LQPRNRKGLVWFWGGLVISAFLLVFLFVDFFSIDFRLWVLAVPTFTPNKLAIALIYLPFFLIYFLANSIAINSFNRFTIRGREWGNTAVLVLANVIETLILVVAQYSHFFVTGDLTPGFGGVDSIWLFPSLIILPFAAIATRKIYRATKNPYIGGFIMAGVVTVVSVLNTLTYTSSRKRVRGVRGPAGATPELTPASATSPLTTASPSSDMTDVHCFRPPW
jgi:hypothetical protein